MLRKVIAIEEILQSSSNPQKIDMKPEDKIVAVLFKNQGTAILKTGMNSSNGINKTLPGATMPYGIEGAIMEGYITVEFDSVGDGECVVVTYKDAGEIDC